MTRGDGGLGNGKEELRIVLIPWFLLWRLVELRIVCISLYENIGLSLVVITANRLLIIEVLLSPMSYMVTCLIFGMLCVSSIGTTQR